MLVHRQFLSKIAHVVLVVVGSVTSRLSSSPSHYQVECDAPTRSRFPDIYREFESLQGRVRQAAQDYIVGPQVGPLPLEVRNIEVRSVFSLGSRFLVEPMT